MIFRGFLTIMKGYDIVGKDLKGKELGVGILQRKDGVYYARYVNRFGKRESIYNTKLSTLKTLLNEAIYEDNNCLNAIDNNTTLDDWHETWESIHKHGLLRDSSKLNYGIIYRLHISPSLGRMKLNEVTQVQIKALIRSLAKKGLGFETQNKVRNLLLDMFGKAMNDNFVNRNPAKGIVVKRNEEIERKVLTTDEQREFFDCARGTFYDNLFTVAVSSGLRQGELCALRLSDIDFKNKTISITRTLLYQKIEELGDTQKTFRFGPPKTKTSVRKVPINRQCELALKKQIIQKNVIATKRPKKVEEQFKDLLFTTKFNTPLNVQNVSDAIKKIVDEINLTKDMLEEMECFSSHTFRHTFATRCFEAGIDAKTVQKYLGHASIKMTMDLYTHVLGEHQANEMDKLESQLDGSMSVSDNKIDQQFDKLKMV